MIKGVSRDTFNGRSRQSEGTLLSGLGARPGGGEWTMNISRFTRALFFLLLAGLLIVSSEVAAAPDFIYVDKLSPSTAPDGLSWATAFKTIQEGVNKAVTLGTGTVRVAGGTYPETVTLPSGLWLMGGYLGNSDPEAAPQDTDPEHYPTIIDGENTRVCIIGSGSLLLSNIRVRRGHGVQGGGAVSIGAQVGATNCVFEDNTADSMGGAAYVEGGSGYFHQCLFKNNSALDGGGALANVNSTIQIMYCTFNGNSSHEAGAVHYISGSARVRNCVFFRNQAVTDGAAMAINGAANIVSNCTFAENDGTAGSTLMVQGATSVIANCIFWDNEFSEIAVISSPTATVTYCDIRGGAGGEGNINADPRFRDVATGDLHLTISSPCVDSGRDTSGTNYGMIFDDIEGNDRKAFFTVPGGDGSGYDIGAYEFAPAIVTFPDAALEALVREAAGIPAATLYEDDVRFLTSLSGDGVGVGNLSGLEFCVNLEILTLPRNSIVNVTPLRNLARLNFVNLEGNNIADIAPLALNTGLGLGDTLNLLGNPLSSTSINVAIPALAARGVTVFYGGVDTDGDGLSNLDETNVYHTNPNDPDTDNDGINDGDEVANGLNPRDGKDALLDVDVDGLTALEEIAARTDPHHPDTDRDGMSDGFEVQYGLNPLDPTDGPADADGDGWTNREEYLRGSDPTNAANPSPVYFVSDTTGLDTPGNGTLLNPWRTISYALDKVPTGPAIRPTIILLPGAYNENVVLKTGVNLISRNEGLVIVQGRVTGASGCWMRDIQIRQAAGDATGPLLTLNNVSMTVERVVFRGQASSQATGVTTYGANPASALFTDCTFTSLRTGIEIFGSIPKVRRCLFDKIFGNAIVIREKIAKADDAGNLGDASDPNSGWNTFRDVDGYVILNERDEEVRVQRTNWGTNDPSEIEDKTSGNVDTGYPLPKNASLVPGSIVCVVYDQETQAPVTNATVRLSPGNFSPVTENTEGVYAMACLSAGDYTVNVTAPSLEEASQSAHVTDGQELVLMFPMSVKSGNGGGGCMGGALSDPYAARPGQYQGDLLVVLLLVFALMASRAGMPTPAVLRRRP